MGLASLKAVGQGWKQAGADTAGQSQTFSFLTEISVFLQKTFGQVDEAHPREGG